MTDTNNTDGAALLPCPLCGRHAFVHFSDPGYPVWCSTDRCLKLPPRETEAEAITAWNARTPLPATQEDAERSGAGRKLGEWAAKNLRPDNATPQRQEYDGEALREAIAFIDKFFEPWGAWKTVWWEGEVSGDAAFSADNALKHVANILRLAALAHPAQARDEPESLDRFIFEWFNERDPKAMQTCLEEYDARSSALSSDKGEER